MSPKEGRTMKRIGLLVACILYACVVMVVPVEAATITVRADGTGDYPTIQAAINAANPGDEVVLERGTYAGYGNHNLDFNAKAITVRSLEPENNACMRETIIDAEGHGVIVRFLNDEGPESIFEGFTLLAGDTSVPVHGIAGLFEFSDNARPTTKRLRIGRDIRPLATPTKPHISQGETLLLTPPYGAFLWDGNNPFHQPAKTTDYYGSGDVDNDGNLTSADVFLAQDMADGMISVVARADVDGDQDVDNDDVSLISSTLSGGILAGWWNHLKYPFERDLWIDRLMEIDKTDQHYGRYWFQCLSFAVQTYIHAAYYRGELMHTFYNGGQTMFNVPMYYTSVSAPSYGHGINCILVGFNPNPLNFYDWRFIEPQTDDDVEPGMWDMPYGATIKIMTPTGIAGGGGGFSASVKVKFYVDETGCTLEEYSDDLILTKPATPTETPDNRPDLWNPRIVPVKPPMILFDRSRQDLSRTTDVHLTALPFVDPPEGSPLTLSSQYSRLLDISKAPDGTIHLLWKGKPDYTPGAFHGTLDPVTGRINNVTRASTGVRAIRMGRVVATTEDEIHVFWLEQKTNSSHPYETGIYWTRWTGSAWQSEENIAPYTDYLPGSPGWAYRDFLRYYFDVDVLGNGNIIVVWAEPNMYTDDAVIRQLRYDGSWGTITDLETTNTRGIELLTDSIGTLHMVYWPGITVYDRGNLLHRTSEDNGASWSAAETLDAGGYACCPRMVAGIGDAIYLAWEREVDTQVVPVLRKYEDGAWAAEQEFTVRPGADAWYPIVDVADGNLVVAWSSRSADRVTIEAKVVERIFDGFDEDKDVDLVDFAIFALAWSTEPGHTNWNPDCDIYCPTDNIINELDLAVFTNYWLTGAK
ncbi:MAG TPA: hypothetical protein HPP66_01055 [Planctomycetes bacterium]|nr:hypothetical protein [Planctomycetota bacterium]